MSEFTNMYLFMQSYVAEHTFFCVATPCSKLHWKILFKRTDTSNANWPHIKCCCHFCKPVTNLRVEWQRGSGCRQQHLLYARNTELKGKLVQQSSYNSEGSCFCFCGEKNPLSHLSKKVLGMTSKCNFLTVSDANEFTVYSVMLAIIKLVTVDMQMIVG